MGEALQELLPRKVRLALYVTFGVGALGLAAYQAAEGDWLVFAASLGLALTNVLAAGNITPAPEAEASPALEH